MSGGPLLCQTKRKNLQLNAIIEEVMQNDGCIDGVLSPESFCEVPEAKLVKVMQKVQFDMTVKKKLGSFDPIWLPFRGDDILPNGSVESLIAECPPVMTGYMADEWLYFRQMFSTLAPDLAGPTKKSKALDFVFSSLRSHFGQTVLDDSPGDVERWRHYADMLYSKVEDWRCSKGLPVDVQSICGGAMQLCWFEYGSDRLARLTNGYSFTIWGPSGTRNANGHFREIPMVFNFGHPLVHNLYDPSMLGSPENTEDRVMSEVLMQAIASFARTRHPVVLGLEWSPYPANMNLQVQPSASVSNGELDLHNWFTELRPEILAEFNIEETLFECSIPGDSASEFPHLIGRYTDQKPLAVGGALSECCTAGASFTRGLARVVGLKRSSVSDSQTDPAADIGVGLLHGEECSEMVSGYS
jgi:hypothetical protein